MKKFMIALSGILLYAVIAVSVNFYGKVNPVSVATTAGDLDTQLRRYIEQNEMRPIEPRHDFIFHFVPGLKGIEIDYGLSYHNMVANGSFDESLIVRREVECKEETEQFRGDPMYKGNEKGDYVALMINVAWGEQELDQIIKILTRLKVPATFFFEGKYAEKHPDQVEDIHRRGHVVGNHSYSHPSRWGRYSYDGFTKEIVKTNEVLEGIIGEKITYFAPPGGEYNEKTLAAAYDQGMYTILWTADTVDWKGGSADAIIERVMKKVEPGALILMHPKPNTVAALESLIEILRNEGYGFKTIDQMVTGQRPECY